MGNNKRDRRRMQEEIRDRYDRRILAILRKIAESLRHAGFAVDEPAAAHDDEYRWEFAIRRDPEQGSGDGNVEVTFRLCESEKCDGDAGGVNFGLDVVEWGGRILGDMCPFNYTDECWVDRADKKAVEQRFALVEGADFEKIADLLR